jgi:hypothetical protein
MSQSTESLNFQPQESTTNSTVLAAKKSILKNWKTTSIGLVLSLTGFVAFSPKTFGGEQAPLVQVCKYVASGGLAALGIVGKDFNSTGRN